MTHKCNYCKQIKPCRKNKLYSDGAGVGYPSIWFATEWVCENCDKYFFYQYKEAEKQLKINKEKRIKEFIIKRDNVLKKLNKK